MLQSQVVSEPYGVVLCIGYCYLVNVMFFLLNFIFCSPWNYPITLLLHPLAGAIAAGSFLLNFLATKESKTYTLLRKRVHLETIRNCPRNIEDICKTHSKVFGHEC